MSGVDVTVGLREVVAARVAADPDVGSQPADRSALRAAVARALAAEGIVVAPQRWAQLVRDLVDELGGLGPLEALLRDPEVTDVMVNAPDEVWVERAGDLVRTEISFADDEHVLRVLRRVLGPIGVRLDRAHPWADAVLDDGVRLHALLPPVAPAPVVTLRRVPAVAPSWDDLAASGSVTPEAAACLTTMVRERRNIVVCGRAGAGKTTLLSRLLGEIGDDRAVIIEDAPELHAPSRHAIALRVLAASPDGGGGVDVATLVRNALRMRPDRIVVGEVRGHEVANVLQAMNTGHSGSMTTVHAHGASDALVRLEGMALLAGIPVSAVRAQLATAVDVVVALRRGRDGRRHLAEIAEVEGGTGGVTATRIWP